MNQKNSTDPTAAVSAMVEEMYPDEELRHLILDFLADAIETAHASGPKSWALSVDAKKSYANLNVGRLATFALHPERVLVALDVPSLGEDLVARLVEASEREGGSYDSMPTSRYWSLRPDTLPGFRDQITPALAQHIENAAKAVSATPYAKSHSAPALEYLILDTGRDLPSPERWGESSLDTIIDEVRSAAGPELVESRKSFEDQARALLEKAAGRMSREQAQELGDILNSGHWGGTLKKNRFLPGFSVPLVDQMVADIDRFNELTDQLWRGSEEEALQAADEIFRDRGVLPGSGRSYPSVLLYLRDPAKYAIWFDSLDRGLSELTDYHEAGREGGSDAYLRFSDNANEFALENHLEPQELDAVLSHAAREATRRRAEERKLDETPTISREAFEFLDELAENNNKEWLDANRHRYEQHLRDPLTAVLQEIADRFIVSLDPELNVEVKRDSVLARFYKWSQGAPYYTYLWGAFSRGKKQEDIQLMVSVDRGHLHHGLFLGSASKEVRERLAVTLLAKGDGFVEMMNRRVGPDAVWGHQDQPPSTVATAQDAAGMGAGRSPYLRRYVKPDDPLIGSPQLVNAIGEMLTDVYPIAALGWGEDIGDVVEPEPDEPIRSGYSFRALASDTLLPTETLEEWIDLLRGPKRAALFYGPPGTGKTWVVEKLAKYLAGTNGEAKTVQFHPSFSYEDFIEGLRPVMKDGQIGYEIRDGVFKTFCEEARGKDGDYVFVIDEINRAELGSVLGEVMMLIEYRDRAVPLPYSQRPFSIPRNVVLLATMNTADRSLALVDFALRRRFHALRMLPDGDVLSAYHGADGALALAMFDLVKNHVDSDDYAPGHTYWMLADTSAQGLQRLWNYELRPYLSEYWFESRSRLDELEKEVIALLGEGA